MGFCGGSVPLSLLSCLCLMILIMLLLTFGSSAFFLTAISNFCTSSKAGGPGVIVRKLRAGDYVGGCNAILEYKFAAGYDCSTLINGQPNRRCYGVWKDRLRLQKQCLEAQ